MGDISAIRPTPAASGTLAKTPLIHLVLYVLNNGLAGTLELRVPGSRSALIQFLGGQPAKAWASDTALYLGQVLCELGHLSPGDLSRSLDELAVAKSQGPALHGQLLLAAGAIDESKLEAGLREQLARKLLHIASFPPETTYAYYDLFDGLSGWGVDATAGFDPMPMIWVMLQQNPIASHVEAALAKVQGSPLRLAAGANVSRLGLGADRLKVVQGMRERPLRLHEVAAAHGLTDPEARLLVYFLLVTKQLDVLRPTDSAIASTVGPSSAATARISEPTPPPPKAIAPAARSMTPAQGFMLQGQPTVPPARSEVVITPRPPPATRSITPAPRRSVTPTTVAKSKTPSPQARMTPRGMPAASGSSVPSPPPDGGTRSAPSMPPDLSLELRERWEEVVRRATTIDRTDYFNMLGLSRDATKDKIESAFYALVKKWHPDRLPPELAPIRDACSRVFARMTEAHSTLTDEHDREDYMRLLADGSGSPETQEKVAKVIEAATNFQKAEVCLRRGDNAQAETLCAKAHDADPSQPDYIAMLAWLIQLKPENQTPEKLKLSLEMLDRAIQLSNRCEKAFFWRGMIRQRMGRTDAAVRDFRRAAELNPRNIDAAREVRLYRMRGGRSTSPPGISASGAPPARQSPMPGKPDPGKASLLNRLFKK